MPHDQFGRYILSDTAYTEYLEDLVLAATRDMGNFDEIVIEDEHFVLYNMRETIQRQKEYRCQQKQESEGES